MRLLIKRDETRLVPARGKAEVETDVPDWMKIVHSADLNIRGNLQSRKDDLLIINPEDCTEMKSYLNSYLAEGVIPAIWSGYRSVLVSDGVIVRVVDGVQPGHKVSVGVGVSVLVSDGVGVSVLVSEIVGVGVGVFNSSLTSSQQQSIYKVRVTSLKNVTYLSTICSNVSVT